MSRERSFDEREVLDRVTDLFATHGYGATSMSMLVESTGLGKQSLYNAFGDKRELYLRAIERAIERYRPLAAALANGETGRAGVDAYFALLLTACLSSNPAVNSCIVNAGLLEGVDDESMRLTLQAKWTGTHELLRAAIERGQRDGSIASTAPSAELADVLMNLTSGLRVMAKSASGARLHQACERALAVLDIP